MPLSELKSFGDLPLDIQFLLLIARSAGKKAKTWSEPIVFPLGAAVLTASGNIFDGHKFEGPCYDPGSGYEALDSIGKRTDEEFIAAALVGPNTPFRIPGTCYMTLVQRKVGEIYLADCEFKTGVHVTSLDRLWRA